jgi:tetratricopeptide (TPR) repeat protein
MKRVALGCCLLLAGLCGAEEKGGWTARETRLANDYLGLLVSQPEEGRVLDLLWQLYASHGETELLIANIAAQAAARPHPSVTLVRAHLLKKKGDLEAAAGLYAEVLKGEPGNGYALRAAARTAAERERRGEAIGFYEALAGVLEAGSGERLAAWLEAGDLALGGGEVERAAGFWEKAAGEQPGSLDNSSRSTRQSERAVRSYAYNLRRYRARHSESGSSPCSTTTRLHTRARP